MRHLIALIFLRLINWYRYTFKQIHTSNILRSSWFSSGVSNSLPDRSLNRHLHNAWFLLAALTAALNNVCRFIEIMVIAFCNTIISDINFKLSEKRNSTSVISFYSVARGIRASIGLADLQLNKNNKYINTHPKKTI